MRKRDPIKKGEQKRKKKKEKSGEIFSYLWIPSPQEKCVIIVANNINIILLS